MASRRTFDIRCREARRHWINIAKLAAKYPLGLALGVNRKRAEAGTPLRLAPAPADDSVWKPPRVVRRPHIRGERPLPILGIERVWQMMRLYENWPLAMADRLGLIRRREVVYSVRRDFGRAHLVARMNGCDVRTINELWVGELYTKLFDGTSPSNRVVVDIGANCGYFAVYVGLRLPGVKVFCFEPDKENRRLAILNVGLNGIDAEVRGEAVIADGRSRVELNLSKDPRLHTTVARAEAANHGIETGRYTGAKVSVPAVNINAALKAIAGIGRIALLKIDVEGIDLDLVAALDHDVLGRTDYLVAETEGRDTTSVVTKLTAAGFLVFEDTNLVTARRVSEGPV
ncbi:MAG: FkbM family methyltransferase [Actinobacteria bacterium]|nr:FkbM family methyltransferase [Actinomycetota bacterium]